MVRLLDIAHTNTAIVGVGATLLESYIVMTKSELGAVVLLDKGRPRGILTERDAIRLLCQGVSQHSAALEYCTAPVVVMELDNIIEEALQVMQKHNIRRIVVTQEGKFFGLIVQEDLLGYMEKEIYQSSLCVKHLDCVSKEVFTVDESLSIEHALTMMNMHRVSNLPTTSGGVVKGIFTERDAVVLASSPKLDLQRPIKEVAKPCISANEESLVYELIRTMLKTHASAVIQDDDGRPIGIVSIRDLFRNLSSSHGKFLTTKLSQAKETLNFVTDPVIEILVGSKRGNVIEWMNNSAVQRFGKHLFGMPVESIIAAERFALLLSCTRDRTCERERLIIRDRVFLANVSMAKVNSETIVQLVLADITEIENLNKNIQEHLRFQQQIIDAVPAPLFYIDKKGDILGCNDAFANFMSITKSQAIGKNFSHITEANIAASFCKGNEKLILKGGSIEYEDRLQDRDGKNIYGIFKKSTLRDKKGETSGIIGLFFDISDRKIIEQKLQTLNTKLEEEVKKELALRLEHEMISSTIFDTAPVGILMTNSHGGICKLNKTVCDMFGLTADWLMDRRFDTLVCNDDKQRMLEAYMELMSEKEEHIHTEFHALRRDGRQLEAYASAGRLRLSDGQLYAIFIIADMTQLKEVQNRQKDQERMLIQQSKMAAMGEMIGAIAHQWRQPLNALGLIIQDTKMAFEFGELDAAYVENMVGDAKIQISHMSNTIDDFRNFFRPEKQKEPFEIAAAIEDVLSMIAGLLKNNYISVEIEAQNAWVLGYRNEFKQVVLNLVNNAKDAILEKVAKGELLDDLYKIKISVQRSEEAVQIEIQDHAGGVPKSVIHRIFEPYYTTKEQGKGTGIGLYMSRSIIEESMGGQIGVYNHDNGAVFWVKLPAFEE